jgi:spermidine/putrescine transport system ATP-binding protein
MPWDAELTVFTQNLAVGGVLPVGTPVSLAWDPAHTFALEGDASAGAQLEDALAGVG